MAKLPLDRVLQREALLPYERRAARRRSGGIFWVKVFVAVGSFLVTAKLMDIVLWP